MRPCPRWRSQSRIAFRATTERSRLSGYFVTRPKRFRGGEVPPPLGPRFRMQPIRRACPGGWEASTSKRVTFAGGRWAGRLRGRFGRRRGLRSGHAGIDPPGFPAAVRGRLRTNETPVFPRFPCLRGRPNPIDSLRLLTTAGAVPRLMSEEPAHSAVGSLVTVDRRQKVPCDIHPDGRAGAQAVNVRRHEVNAAVDAAHAALAGSFGNAPKGTLDAGQIV